MAPLIPLTLDDFPAAVAEGAVLVDFGAPWCGPCKALEPLLADLSENLSGQLRVLKVNVDTAPQLAADLGVLSVPTLILFKNGRKIAGRSGALSAGQLRTFVEPALAHAPTQI